MYFFCGRFAFIAKDGVKREKERQIDSCAWEVLPACQSGGACVREKVNLVVAEKRLKVCVCGSAADLSCLKSRILRGARSGLPELLVAFPYCFV